MKKTTTTNTTTEKNATNTLNINKLTIQELRNFLDYAYNSLSNKKEIKKDGKEKMALDLLLNLRKKKVILKKSEYTDTVKILLSEFPNLKKFFSNEETQEEVKDNNKKEEVKKETEKEVKKEETKKEVKAEEIKEVKKKVAKNNKENERAFPSGIKLERKTFRKVDSITFDEVKKRVDERKDTIIAYYWTQQDIEVFGYNANNEHIKKPTQFRYNLDLSKVVYATDNLIYAVSLQTDAMYLLTSDDFNRHSDGYLYSGGVEFEIYIHLSNTRV